MRCTMRDQIPELTGFDAADIAVEGEGHGVEDGGLARACRAGDHKQVELAELNLLQCPERSEALDAEVRRSHPGLTSSRSSSKRSSSSFSGSAECRSV